MDSGGTSSYFSPSSSTPRCVYGSFISFRGEDTRTTFVDHLYYRLKQFGIHTFRDDVALPRGNSIKPELIAAIRDSRVSIVVFSENYCGSSWCLDELVVIMESRRSMGQRVIPVFYHVDPSDVRKQTGIFKDAFAKHEETYGANNLKTMTWREALSEAGNLSGFHINGGHEAEAITEIVLDVDRYLNHDIVHVAKYTVGLESPNSPVARLREMLMTNPNDVTMVGIFGIGGIGKTTISKALYNLVMRHFEGSCFLANVREESQGTNGLVRLQKRLLSETLKMETFKVVNVDQGICLIKQRLCHKRVLIILDDVDSLKQLNSLVEDRSSFGVGSRIVLTTRNKHLLNQAKVDEQHEVMELVPSDSLRLFSLHAFQKSEPLEGFTEISGKFVSYTGGHPLSLEVIGASLFRKSDMEEWESTLQKLQKVPPREVHEILKISFDALDDDKLKTIFLDISCVFIGTDKEQAMRIFDSCDLFGTNGISILIDKCLLTISKDKKLHMHDLIRDMGREIVRAESPDNPGKRSRLWHPEDVQHVLKRHKGSKAIRSLVFDPPTKSLVFVPPTKMHLNASSFSGMKYIRFLQMDNIELNGSFEGLFEELSWLRWHCCPFLPPKFCPEKLAYFDLQYSTISTWQGKKPFHNLRFLNLSHSQFRTTPDFTQLPGLEELSLIACPNLLNLHPSVGLLAKLKRLDLQECKKLRSLPSTICNLTTLQHLDLNSCSSLDRLPEDLGGMKGLMTLHASVTAIKQLPHSIGNLKKLEELSLRNCPNLLTVHPSVGLLAKLKRLDLGLCDKLRSLPSSICSLTTLECLDLDWCSSLDRLPEDLGGMKGLMTLNASETEIKQLPHSIGNLKKLERLYLPKYDKNTEVWPWYSLLPLNILLQRPVTTRFLPPSFSGLCSLIQLDLSKCDLSEEDMLDNLEGLISLKSLNLTRNNFSTLPACLAQLSNLKSLWLDGCRSLHSILGCPPNLSSLYARDCTSLKNLPNLSNLKRLRWLELDDCRSLVEIHGLENLESLLDISLEGCSNLTIDFVKTMFEGYTYRKMGCCIALSRREVPDWMEYKSGGSSIVFDVPLDVQPHSLQFTLWVNYCCANELLPSFDADVYNRTSNTKWTVSGYHGKAGTWVWHRPPGHPMESGDTIEVSVIARKHYEDVVRVEEMGVHLAYRS